MATTTTTRATAATVPPVLRAESLTKTFATTDPPTQVLGGVDLDVAPGEFLAVMGASGSGKSTLLYCLSGMDRPSSGTVAIEGRDVTGLNDDDMARLRLTTMGFVFQQAYFLSNLSIRDNILLPALKAAGSAHGRATAIARVDALMERFGIAHVGSHGTTEVSGGQLQRASICRALAAEPTIVFADEPTGALNSGMTAEVMDALTQVHRGGATLVMVTHAPDCAARADRVIYLRDGGVVDSLTLGPRTPEEDAARATAMLEWLRAHGF